MNEVDVVKKNQNVKSIIVLVITLIVIFSVVAFFSRELAQVSQFIRTTGWWGRIVSVLIFGLFGATPIPSEPVTVLITSIFGPISAAVITSLGNLLAAVVEFYIGTKVGNVADFNKLRAKLPFGLNKLPVDSPVFLIVARMLPGYGPKFISIISGIYKVPLKRYLWTTAVATSVGALVVAFGGYGLLSLFGIK